MQHLITTTKYNARAVAFVLDGIRERAVSILLFGIVLFAFLYVYFIGSAVMHAVVRREVQQDMAQTSSRVAELEVAYLQHQNGVTQQVANELGFTHIAQKDYVERTRYLGQANAR